MKLQAYYYGFEPTGNLQIDNILKAVALAGKAFHNTADWNEKASYISEACQLQGDSPVEWIQRAAEQAARNLKIIPNDKRL